jgi:hypothetical protein
MFEELRLIGGGDRQLPLATKGGTQIANSVAPAPEARHLLKYKQIRQKHSSWRSRKDPCGEYNCYGMLFASRRTAIYEDVEVSRILTEDGYRQIPFANAAVDDIAVYQAFHGFVHAGRIVEVGVATEPSLRPIIVLSKWDDTTGEDLHMIWDVPFKIDRPIEIWTDRR